MVKLPLVMLKASVGGLTCACAMLAVVSGSAEATERSPEVERDAAGWASFLAPMRAGKAELRLGALASFALSGETAVAWRPLYSARLGLSDRVQLGLPLMVTLRLLGHPESGGALVVTGGLMGIGWSSLTGPLVSPYASVGGHWIEGDLAWTIACSGGTGLLPLDLTGFVVLSASFARRVNARVSFGLSASATLRLPFQDGPGVIPAAVSAGSGQLSPVLMAPTLRVRLIESLVLEFWLQLLSTAGSAAPQGQTGVTLAWSPTVWSPPPTTR